MNNDDDNETMSKIDCKCARAVVMQRPTTHGGFRMMHTRRTGRHMN